MIETSIVIATYNRADRLRVCLDALARQTAAPNEFDVVVVVDGSTDSTREMLDGLRVPFALRVIWQENQGQCAALNRGAEAAVAPTCLFLDDDILAAPDLVSAHQRLHTEHARVVGIGQLELALPDRAGWYERSFARDWRAHYSRLNQGGPPNWDDLYGGNMSVAREAFLAAGGFDVGLRRAYDVELGRRLDRSGYRFVYLPHALGIQDERKDYRALMLDAERGGQASVELYRRDPTVLPKLLGWFSEQPPGLASALRVLLALDVAPRHIAPLGRLLRRANGQDAAYRLLHRYSYWRGVHHAWPDPDGWHYLTTGTPILMYHALGEPREPQGRYVVPVRRFAQQMAWLQRMGYRVLALEELIDCRTAHRTPPARSVVITIDDGYRDTWSLAYPILRRYDMPATVALVSDRVGQMNCWDDHGELFGRALLSWSEIFEMQRLGGMQFAAHSCTHPDLTRLPPEAAREEIEGSRTRLEDRLGSAVPVFVYPYGKRDAEVTAAVEQLGFAAGCGIETGINTPLTPSAGLRRVEIWGTDSIIDFALAVRFGARPDVLATRIKQVLSWARTGE